MKDRRCPYCQQVFWPDPYHPQQLVCSQANCQRQRRRDYHRQKIASDPVYHQVCVESPRKWREARTQTIGRNIARIILSRWNEIAKNNACGTKSAGWRILQTTNLAICQVPVVQSPDSSGLVSTVSCKQQPSGIAPAASL